MLTARLGLTLLVVPMGTAVPRAALAGAALTVLVFSNCVLLRCRAGTVADTGEGSKPQTEGLIAFLFEAQEDVVHEPVRCRHTVPHQISRRLACAE